MLRQLEYFCAVAGRGSFTRAAEDCFVSQSAMSQQIKSLEAELGCQLIERKGRSFSLTPAGEHLARRGRVLLDESYRLRCEVEDIAFGLPRSLTVGYLNRYDGWEVAGAIAAFTRRHPNVEVKAVPGSHDDLYQKMLSGEIDLAFNDRRRALSDDFFNRYLMRSWSYIEVSEASALVGLDEVAATQLAGETCIIVTTPEQEHIEREYYRDRLNFDCVFLRADTLEQARFMVAGGRGFLPVGARNEAGPTGTVIRRIPLMEASSDGSGVLEHAHIDYYAFWLRAHERPMTAEFAEILAGLFGE